MTKRHWFSIVAAVIGVASVVAGRERPVLEPPAPAKRLETQARTGDELDLGRLAGRARVDEGVIADPFANASFASPARAAGHAAPQAPALPFTYVGKMIEDGRLQVFLAEGDKSFSVTAGQTLSGQYRVDKVTEAQVTFTYLPLKKRQTLNLTLVN